MSTEAELVVGVCDCGECDWKSIIMKIIHEDSSFETYFMAYGSDLEERFQRMLGRARFGRGQLEGYHSYRGDIRGYLVKIAELHGSYRVKKYLQSNSSHRTRRVVDSDEEVDGGSDDPDGAEELVPHKFPKPARRDIKDIDTAIKLDSQNPIRKWWRRITPVRTNFSVIST
ncbi:hypothetical protein BJ742DRAFT_742088 [Cladochytrium replicatum]|nr:hypothetical protein BJ742DRAFT_742088 [Cladochytrium replicatum]